MTGPAASPQGSRRHPMAVGLDLGGTKLLGVVIDDQGRVINRVRHPSPHGAEEVIALAASIVDKLCPDASVPVGFGLPGLVGPTGTLHVAPHFPNLVDLDVVGDLGALTHRRVVAANDSTLAALSEAALGAAVGLESALVISLGSGIGGGIVSGGRVLFGADGFGGELGHMTIDVAGPKCLCGRLGCWEMYASGNALRRLALNAARSGRLGGLVEMLGGIEGLRGEHITEAAAVGDRDAARVVEEFARWVVVGLINLVNVIDPEMIVLAGGVSRCGGVVLEPVRAHFAAESPWGLHRNHPRFKVAALKENAAAVGAALFAARPGFTKTLLNGR